VAGIEVVYAGKALRQAILFTSPLTPNP